MNFKRDKKEEESGEASNPFGNLEKTTVLQEARAFNDSVINPRKCTMILSKVLYLLNQGEVFGTTEATETFFAITKLFQSKDPILRRMVYLGIKELSHIAEDVIIVTSSLTKDMTGKEDLYRGAAIRALCTITDASMLQALERYLKQAIVDKLPHVSSAALVRSYHLTSGSGELIKRWVSEVQEALNSDNVMVQYHALGVLYHIRKADRLAVTKLVSRLTKSHMKSPFAVSLLIRIAAKLVDEEEKPLDSPFFDFLESCLRHKSELVIFEAAHAIINLKNVTAREINPAVSVLQLFCSSPKPALRFAAVRTLNKVAISHPTSVTNCNVDLENLITDSNRSIATLAITTLLKTGAESSIDRLMKQIASFVSEISDEFKVVVVQAIKSLCLKFPRKHATLMSFLSALLRDEGGLDYKAAIADTIITIIEENPEAKETGLAHLSEFIEDCEHTVLAVRILNLLGKEGPKTKQPSKYIRYIYNRVILEQAPVRAAAVSALAQFAAHCPNLLPNILVLLMRCQMDSDDEVRDRATLYFQLLSSGDRALTNQFILNNLQQSVLALEKALGSYLQGPTDAPFDIKTVALASVTSDELKPTVATPGILKTKPAEPKKAPVKEVSFLDEVSNIPDLARLQLGGLFKTCTKQPLTESETEYVVTSTKHVFSQHLVLQFHVQNTLPDQLLENVKVQLDVPDGFRQVAVVAIPKLPYGTPANAYCVLAWPEDLEVASGATIGATLKFIVKDCDPDTGVPDSDEGYDDEYVLEDVDVNLSDHIFGVTRSNFAAAWEEITTEREETYALSNANTIPEAVKNIVDFLGLHPCDRSDRVPEGKSSHAVALAGVFRGGIEILARAKLVLSDGVNLQLTVRAQDELVAELITASVG
ncbi:unnamed protein product [Orchesella dallaii]|uniref:Coatomer subunit gamma n=1 Tax=Orchesella dallaii TaxID=48710 RepID=A0ABP1Q5Z5_9HEXA